MNHRYFWYCNVCDAQNSCEDGECQFCECGGASCKRDNCSGTDCGQLATITDADRAQARDASERG